MDAAAVAQVAGNKVGHDLAPAAGVVLAAAREAFEDDERVVGHAFLFNQFGVRCDRPDPAAQALALRPILCSDTAAFMN